MNDSKILILKLKIFYILIIKRLKFKQNLDVF